MIEEIIRCLREDINASSSTRSGNRFFNIRLLMKRTRLTIKYINEAAGQPKKINSAKNALKNITITTFLKFSITYESIVYKKVFNQINNLFLQ